MMLIYGQGCDIPDIDFVVQWKAPASTSSWVQRAGRAARAPGREGLAVLLVEKTAFETNPAAMSEKAAPTKANRSQVAQRGRGRGRGGGRGGKRGASYAVLHGQKRGTRSGINDAITVRDEPSLSDDAPAEGLFVFIQTTICRRRVLEKVFANEPSSKFCAYRE
jgi:superfamily II DNA helicase RecQ